MAGRAKLKSRQQQRREEARIVREGRERRKRLMIIAGSLALLSVVALIFAEVFLGGGGTTIERAEGVNRSGRTLGSPTAPVVLTVWEDFQCPFCKKANEEALAEVEKQYVTTGAVRIEYRHYAFLGNESLLAAQASECAAEQHFFWEYHDILFANQSGENRGAFSEAKLKRFAAEAGLSLDAFDACLDGERYKSAVEAETALGKEQGVSSTPTFFVNETKITGAQPFSTFQSAIEGALRGR
jgi:protein-disulfide isomerase